MRVVSACAKCGNPIYGPKSPANDGSPIEVKRTCLCLLYAQQHPKPFAPLPATPNVSPQIYPPFVSPLTIGGSLSSSGQAGQACNAATTHTERPPDEDDAFVAA